MADARNRRDFTRAEVLAHLEYEPETGLFLWKHPRGCRPAGSQAGTIKDGYLQIKIMGRCIRAHRIAWLIQTGAWPAAGFVVDHVNRVRSDNRWENLRLADTHQNGTNSGMRSDNSSGHIGVFRHSPESKWWQAKISVDGKNRHLGTFDSKEAAIAARVAAANEIYGAYSPHMETSSP